MQSAELLQKAQRCWTKPSTRNGLQSKRKETVNCTRKPSKVSVDFHVYPVVMILKSLTLPSLSASAYFVQRIVSQF